MGLNGAELDAFFVVRGTTRGTTAAGVLRAIPFALFLRLDGKSDVGSCWNEELGFAADADDSRRAPTS
jgi:hypothetical protein